MNFYITSGTPEFLETVVAKYPNENMLLLHGNDGKSVILHETDGKTKFAAPRKYEVRAGKNALEQRGYFVMYHLSLEDTSREVFINKFNEGSHLLDDEQLIISYRLLVPQKGSDLVLFLTQWTGLHSYEAWQNSSAYQAAFAPLLQQKSGSVQSMFYGESYVTTYAAHQAE